jgi:3-oxoacyl-[acyl-carrier protein] reductase
MKLQGRVALITGAGRNIGKAIALAMAREGADVVVNGLRDVAAIQAVASAIGRAGGRALAIQADVSDPEQVLDMVDRAARELGTIDVLVSNAAIRPYGPVVELSVEEWRRIMAVDLDATFHLSKAVIPGMLRAARGSIIAMSGLAAFGARNNAVAVATAKAGLVGMMRALARDYAGAGVRANTVVPGNIDTERYDQWAYLRGQPPRRVSGPAGTTAEDVPMDRRGLPREVAEACVYLASDASSYITGQVLHVSGGLHAG